MPARGISRAGSCDSLLLAERLLDLKHGAADDLIVDLDVDAVGAAGEGADR